MNIVDNKKFEELMELKIKKNGEVGINKKGILKNCQKEKEQVDKQIMLYLVRMFELSRQIKYLKDKYPEEIKWYQVNLQLEY